MLSIGSPHRLYMTGDFPPGYRRPEDIEIPADKVQVQYARSSGIYPSRLRNLCHVLFLSAIRSWRAECE